MTTKIKDPTVNRYIWVDAHRRGDAGEFVTVAGGGTTAPRADFLAAVESELGVIVIDGLPDVTERAAANGLGRAVYAGGYEEHDEERARRKALGYLAIWRHLRQGPPIDAAQVEALSAALNDAVEEYGFELSDHMPRIARRLVEVGVRVAEVEGR